MENRIKAQEEAHKWRKELCGNVYRHFKGGYYYVDHISVDSEDASLHVIYHTLGCPKWIWDRKLDMFTSPVDRDKYPDAKQEMRFEYVDPRKLILEDANE